MNIIERIIAFVLLIIFMPIFIIIGISIKLSSKGSILFKQPRVGLNGNIFNVYKFRSMKTTAPNVATEELINADEFITGIGKILRITSLDELPQLLNIIKGEMSFVGPRPVIVEEKLLNDLRVEQGVYSVRPGITGWAQINGRDEIDIYQKVKLDKAYIEKKSLLFDIYILFMTVYKVLARKDLKELRSENNEDIYKEKVHL